jgi:type IV pilus assembly protein PilE
MRHMQTRPAQRGVTLIELMIVMVILAIIAAIAIPSYRQQVLKSGRSDAKAALLQTSQTLERCFTRVSTYTGCVVLPVASPEGLYSVTAGEDDEDITATTYQLTATPQAGQAQDTTCGSFTLDQANVRGVSGTGTVEECW